MSSKPLNSKPVLRSNEDGDPIRDSLAPDRISSLPDALLERILSFLPIEQALRTAFLSRRWRFLWTFVPILEFRYGRNSRYCGENGARDLTFFVNNVLINHKAPTLNKFCLRCLVWLDPINVEPWVIFAMLRCVRELDLLIPGVVLPSSIFVFKTLEVLKLEDCLAKIPSSVYLPCLKILHLVRTIFPDRKVAKAFMSCILSGCPVLEVLILNEYVWENDWLGVTSSMTLRICTPTLKRLELLGKKNGSDSYTKIEINAPALKYLKICCVKCDEFMVDNFPDILEAYFTWFSNRWFHQTGKVLETLLSCICKVKVLHLCDQPDIYGYGTINLINVPRLECLKSLELSRGFSKALHTLCESSPNLETLIINHDVYYKVYLGLRMPEESSWSRMLSVPECLMYSLKTFSIFNFGGSQDELELVRYIMEHAQVLNLVTIKCCLQDSEESEPSKWTILKKLAAFPRSSRTCQLEFG